MPQLTPEQKAKELYRIFEKLFVNANADSWVNEAKQCVITLADEIIPLMPPMTMISPTAKMNAEYWQKVKQQIQSI